MANEQTLRVIMALLSVTAAMLAGPSGRSQGRFQRMGLADHHSVEGVAGYDRRPGYRDDVESRLTHCIERAMMDHAYSFY
jgi:hypothetical protein